MAFIPKSVLILIYLSLDLAFGGVVHSDIMVWKPWSQIQSSLNNRPIKYQYTAQPGVIAINSWNLKVPTINVTAESAATNYLVDATSIQMKTDNLSVSLIIPSVSLDQTIEQSVAGNVITVHLSSQCAPISIVNRAIQVQAQLRWLWVDGFPNPALDNLDLFWDDNSWDISAFNCSGPMGINSVFLNQLRTNLKDRGFIRSLLLEKTKVELQRQWSDFKRFLLAGQRSTLNDGTIASLSLNRVAVWNQSGLGLLGQISIELESINVDELKLNLAEQSEVAFDVQKALVPKKLIDLMSVAKIQKTNIPKINLRDNDSFMGLLKSRFLQFFLWPDLMNFKKTSRFDVSFNDFSNLTVNWINKNRTQITGNLTAHVNAERGSNLEPYIDLAFGFSVNADMEQIGKTLSIKAKSPIINFTYRFNADYLKQYQAPTRLSSMIVKKAKAALVESVKIETSLDLSTLLGKTAEILDYNLNGDTAIIDFQNEYLTNVR